MDLKNTKPLLMILLAVGIIFGTFINFQTNTAFGFAWFVNMLWFVIGFPVLYIIGSLIFSSAEKAQKLIEED